MRIKELFESWGPEPNEPVLRPEQAIPPVLQQTTQLYQPYQPKKEDQK